MLENVLKKLAIFFGIALLIGSIFLSYDGFDQSVSGSNSEYTLLAALIGYSLAVTFNLLEFIVSSKTENLNVTLKVLGLLAYGYSIYTNYLGAMGLLHMDQGMAIVVALFMDIVPEPMIAWGLGEAIMHDLFKNLGGFASAPIGKGKNVGSQSHDGGGNNNQNHGGGRPSPEDFGEMPPELSHAMGREARQQMGNNNGKGKQIPQPPGKGGQGHRNF